MAYATLQDAKDLYGEVYVTVAADRDGDGEIDVTAVTTAFDQASSEIDSYLGKHIAVPLTSPSAVVKQVCVDIAFYRLASGPGGGLTDEKKERFKAAITWLTNAARGLVVVTDAVPDAAEADVPQVAPTNAARAFSRRGLRNLL